VFIGASFRAAFLEPTEVGTFAKVLVESVMPVFFRSPMRMTVLLPNVIGALTKDILQALHCALQDVSIIPVRSQRSTPGLFNALVLDWVSPKCNTLMQTSVG
jgi:hypothetical protein